jgi:hypothetical protein
MVSTFQPFCRQYALILSTVQLDMYERIGAQLLPLFLGLTMMPAMKWLAVTLRSMSSPYVVLYSLSHREAASTTVNAGTS